MAEMTNTNPTTTEAVIKKRAVEAARKRKQRAKWGSDVDARNEIRKRREINFIVNVISEARRQSFEEAAEIADRAMARSVAEDIRALVTARTDN